MNRVLRSLANTLFGGSQQPEITYCVPAGHTLYAIGDIHGELQALDRLLARIAEDMTNRKGQTESELVFLGDYVDRGADSAGVVERLTTGALPGVACRFLMGNHEQAMLAFLDDPVGHADWLRFGGADTLTSYGIRASVGVTESTRCLALRDQLAAALPTAHRAFLRGLETHWVAGDYLFVHAGIRPGRRLDQQRPDDLLWIREPFLSWRRAHPKIVVHGHTIVDQPLFLNNRIAIDTGAYATGTLTALVLSGSSRSVLQS